MPLTSRRPPCLTIAITGPNSAASSDGLRTPAPITPLAYPFNSQPPMVMTPDTPAFEISPFESEGDKARGPNTKKPKEADVEWTEEEDALLQALLLRPTGKAWPPTAMPPSEHLDHLVTELLNRHTLPAPDRGVKRGRTASLSSVPTTPSLPLTDGVNTPVKQLDIDPFTTVAVTTSPQPTQQARSAGLNTDSNSMPPRSSWRHYWYYTRRRLFQIATHESRRAVGGHRRNLSESIVPVPAEKLESLPSVVIRPPIRRSGGSFTGAYGDAPPTITEAVRLSTNLQGRAMQSEEELHSDHGLFSPVKIEFGAQVNFAASTANPLAAPNPIIRKAAPSFPPARPAVTGRPSLLQRGVSYTTADLAHMSHSRNASSSSDITMTDVSLGSPSSTEPSPTTTVDRDASIEGEDDVDSFGRTAESAMFSFSFPPRAEPVQPVQQIRTNVDGTEQDPFTPLHQIAFPASVHGLGPRRIGQSPDSTPGSNANGTPDKAPAITFTDTDDVSPLQSAYPSSQTTPRIAEGSFLAAQQDTLVTAQAAGGANDAVLSFARLSITNDTPAFSMGTTTHNPAAGTTAWQAPRMTRSRSELSPLSGHLSRLPPSISIPANLCSHAGPVPISPTTTTSTDNGEGALAYREPKRQRGLQSTASIGRPSTGHVGSTLPLPSGMISGSGRRFNPGLTVIVPKNTGPRGDALRSPFEHKIPNTNGSILTRE